VTAPIAIPGTDLRAAFEQLFGPTDWDAVREPAKTADEEAAEDRLIAREEARREDRAWASPADCDHAADHHFDEPKDH